YGTCNSQEPTFDEIRRFDNFLRRSHVHRTGAIYGKIQLDSLGKVGNLYINSSLDDKYLEEIGFLGYIHNYDFDKSFSNYSIEFSYSQIRYFANESDINYEKAFLISTSLFTDKDYSEFRIIDRYLIGNKKIILLPIQ